MALWLYHVLGVAVGPCGLRHTVVPAVGCLAPLGYKQQINAGTERAVYNRELTAVLESFCSLCRTCHHESPLFRFNRALDCALFE